MRSTKKFRITFLFIAIFLAGISSPLIAGVGNKPVDSKGQATPAGRQPVDFEPATDICDQIYDAAKKALEKAYNDAVQAENDRYAQEVASINNRIAIATFFGNWAEVDRLNDLRITAMNAHFATLLDLLRQYLQALADLQAARDACKAVLGYVLQIE